MTGRCISVRIGRVHRTAATIEGARLPYVPTDADVIASAAHLVAAISDRKAGPDERVDSFCALRDELTARGDLAAFTVNGQLRITRDGDLGAPRRERVVKP